MNIPQPIDYSHLAVSPCGSEAGSQLPHSDDYLYVEGHDFTLHSL